MSFEELTTQLLADLPAEQTEAVFAQDMCEIDGEFIGFIDIYAKLSEIIPKHFGIIDLGCCYAPQCWYFRDHKYYIGVDIEESVRWSMPNTKHVTQPISAFIEAPSPSHDVFAICSYVPISKEIQEAVRSRYRNLSVYYPIPKQRR